MNDDKLKLRQIVLSIEGLENQKKEISLDIKSKYNEAKAMGFNVKALKKIISLRKLDPNKRKEEEYFVNTYEEQLDMN